MAKKTKAEREAEAAAAKLAEQKKNDLTLGTVDNTAINKAAPTTVQSNIKPDEGVVINNNKWNAGELINNPVGFRNQLDIAQHSGNALGDDRCQRYAGNAHVEACHEQQVQSHIQRGADQQEQ